MAEVITKEGHALESTTVKIYRTATVVKGGRRFNFGALVVVGDRQGSVGIGYGKAPGVPAAIEKAQKVARKSLKTVTLQEGTLPHAITSRYGASVVKLLPAGPGTGVIAGATVRAVLELVGVRDCLTKSFGSNNAKNLVQAAFAGLSQLRTKEQIEAIRQVDIGKTEVEERLDAGRRFAPKNIAVPAPAKPTPAKSKPKKGGDKKPKEAGKSPSTAEGEVLDTAGDNEPTAPKPSDTPASPESPSP